MTQAEPVFIASSDDGDYQSHFSGIAYTRNEIVLGADGAKQFFEKFGEQCFIDSVVDGRFFAFLKLGRLLEAFTDPLGQDVLYYYQAGSAWALSNSFYDLANHLKGRVQLTPYEPALNAFFIADGNGFGAQPISNNTSIREIKVLPIGKALKIDLDSQRSDVIDITTEASLHAGHDESYESLIQQGLSEGRDRIGALSQLGATLTTDLSGGQDSRAVFGIVRSSIEDGGALRVVSNPRKEDDYVIATSLAQRYGTRLHHNTGSIRDIGDEDAYRVWKSGNLGVYLPVYPVNTLSPNYGLFKINGGNALAKRFADRSVQEFLGDIRKHYDSDSEEVYQSVRAEFLSALDDIEVDSQDPDAMYLHYLNFRSRFHYGRNWYASLINPVVSPLINRHIIKAFFKLPVTDRQRGRLFMDVLMAIDPVLALHPFDSPGKAFNISDIQQSPFWKETVKKLIQSQSQMTYEVYPPVPKERSLSRAAETRKNGFLSLMKQDFEFFVEHSRLVNRLLSKADIKRARAHLMKEKKFSDRTRLASRVIAFGEIDRLTE